MPLIQSPKPSCKCRAPDWSMRDFGECIGWDGYVCVPGYREAALHSTLIVGKTLALLSSTSLQPVNETSLPAMFNHYQYGLRTPLQQSHRTFSKLASTDTVVLIYLPPMQHHQRLRLVLADRLVLCHSDRPQHRFPRMFRQTSCTNDPR